MNMMKTSEREKTISFSRNYLAIPRVIFTRTDEPFIAGMDDQTGTIAVPRGTQIQEQIQTRYPDIKFLPFDTDSDSLEAVATGQADAYVGNLALASYLILQKGLNNLRVAAPSPFGAHELSFGIRKDWHELTTIINKCLAVLSEKEKNQILTKHYGHEYLETETPISLTPEEKSWLAKKYTVRVHNEKDWPPFNYFEFGQPRGLSIDYMNLLSDKLGLKIEYITGPSWNDFLGMVKRKEIDVMLNIIKLKTARNTCSTRNRISKTPMSSSVC